MAAHFCVIFGMTITSCGSTGCIVSIRLFLSQHTPWKAFCNPDKQNLSELKHTQSIHISLTKNRFPPVFAHFIQACVLVSAGELFESEETSSVMRGRGVNKLVSVTTKVVYG
jgi:hypothetical protein